MRHRDKGIDRHVIGQRKGQEADNERGGKQEREGWRQIDSTDANIETKRRGRSAEKNRKQRGTLTSRVMHTARERDRQRHWVVKNK